MERGVIREQLTFLVIMEVLAGLLSFAMGTLLSFSLFLSSFISTNPSPEIIAVIMFMHLSHSYVARIIQMGYRKGIFPRQSLSELHVCDPASAKLQSRITGWYRMPWSATFFSIGTTPPHL